MDSVYKETFTFFTVSYHGLQIVMFLLMLVYVFKIKQLHKKNSPIISQYDSEEDYK